MMETSLESLYEKLDLILLNRYVSHPPPTHPMYVCMNVYPPTHPPTHSSIFL